MEDPRESQGVQRATGGVGGNRVGVVSVLGVAVPGASYDDAPSYGTMDARGLLEVPPTTSWVVFGLSFVVPLKPHGAEVPLPASGVQRAPCPPPPAMSVCGEFRGTSTWWVI